MSSAIAEWLVGQWTSRFSEILLTMGDVQPKMQVEHLEDSALQPDLLWWEQPLSCAPDALVWTGASEEAWGEIGKVVLEAAGVEASASPEMQSTYLEIVRQAMSSIAQDVGARLGTEVTLGKGAESAPRKIRKQSFRVETELPTKTILLYVVVANELTRSVEAAERQLAEEAARPVEVAPISGDGTLGSRTFELLLDVELPVSVSFGRATIKLQDAIKLITGSMIELDRGLNDPVELLVNNSVIARGEVVVVEGNYGVRITEIVSQKERLQQTRRYMLQ